MKLKASKKDIKNNSNKIIKISYCKLQTLLHYKIPFAYSSGVNGWACDYYNINGVIISTGYSPIGDTVDYKLVQEYEKKVQSIVYNNYDEEYESKVNKVTSLLHEFISEAVKYE